MFDSTSPDIPWRTGRGMRLLSEQVSEALTYTTSKGKRALIQGTLQNNLEHSSTPLPHCFLHEAVRFGTAEYALCASVPYKACGSKTQQYAITIHSYQRSRTALTRFMLGHVC